jgi:hypothetical protein
LIFGGMFPDFAEYRAEKTTESAPKFGYSIRQRK